MNSTIKFQTDFIQLQDREGMRHSHNSKHLFKLLETVPAESEVVYRNGRVATHVGGIEVWVDPAEGFPIWTASGMRGATDKQKKKKKARAVVKSAAKRELAKAFECKMAVIAAQQEN
jgi:hypothetical protein